MKSYVVLLSVFTFTLFFTQCAQEVQPISLDLSSPAEVMGDKNLEPASSLDLLELEDKLSVLLDNIEKQPQNSASQKEGQDLLVVQVAELAQLRERLVNSSLTAAPLDSIVLMDAVARVDSLTIYYQEYIDTFQESPNVSDATAIEQVSSGESLALSSIGGFVSVSAIELMSSDESMLSSLALVALSSLDAAPLSSAEAIEISTESIVTPSSSSVDAESSAEVPVSSGVIVESSEIAQSSAVEIIPESSQELLSSAIVLLSSSSLALSSATPPPEPTNYTLKFDGVNDYVDLPDADFDFSTGLTLECWVKYVTRSPYMRIAEWGNGELNDNFYLTVSDNIDDMYFRVYHANTGVSKIFARGILSDVGTNWTHIAMTLTSDGVVTFYKNGIEHVTQDGGPSLLPNTITRTENFIGNSNWVNDPEMNGQMDEARVWQSVRTEAEIAAGMSERFTGSEVGLKYLWSFDDGVGSTVTDAVAAQNGLMINMDAGTEWLPR